MARAQLLFGGDKGDARQIRDQLRVLFVRGADGRDACDGMDRMSWIESANDTMRGFPLQNLPFCVFQVRGGGQRLGVGIGDSILDLGRLAQSEAMSGVPVDVREACMESTLNRLMACGGEKTRRLRGALMRMLAEDVPQSTVNTLKPLLQPMSAAEFCVPVVI